MRFIAFEIVRVAPYLLSFLLICFAVLLLVAAAVMIRDRGVGVI